MQCRNSLCLTQMLVSSSSVLAGSPSQRQVESSFGTARYTGWWSGKCLLHTGAAFLLRKW